MAATPRVTDPSSRPTPDDDAPELRSRLPTADAPLLPRLARRLALLPPLAAARSTASEACSLASRARAAASAASVAAAFASISAADTLARPCAPHSPNTACPALAGGRKPSLCLLGSGGRLLALRATHRQ